MSLFSSTRCVLILGDEGLQIYNVNRFNARFVDYVPWDTVEFENSVCDLLVKKCKRKPIVILNDMVEQHYRKERVPNVSILDRNTVLQRRLGVAFPNYKIRAALKLDEKSSNLPQGKGGSYLFAAIPATEAFNKMMQAVRMSNATILGFYLLPIESAALVKALSAKVSSGRKGRAVWTIFMGQHQSGGVRQIVTREGELALTRMTPIVDTDVEPELWAKEISSELNATMSYLTRFGYKETDGLNIIVIGNDSTEDYLKAAIHIECNLQVLNSQEAGKLLGVSVGHQADYRYADPLHAAYLGRKSKFRLPMQVTAIETMAKPRKIATFLLLGLLAAAGYFGYEAFTGWVKAGELKEEIRVTGERLNSVKQEYDLELAKKKAIGFDFVLVSNSVELFDQMDKQRIEPLSVFKEIGAALGSDLTIDKIDVKSDKLKDASAEAQAQNNYDSGLPITDASKIIIEAVMTLSFDESVDPGLGVEKTNKFKERLQQRLPAYDVRVIKQVADLSYTGNFVGEAGDVPLKEGQPQDYTAEVLVRGPVR